MSENQFDLPQEDFVPANPNEQDELSGLETPAEAEEAKADVVPKPAKDKVSAHTAEEKPRKAPKQTKPLATAKSATKTTAKRRARKPPRPKPSSEQKFILQILKAVGVEKPELKDLPPLNELVPQKRGTETMKISDIAVFIKEPEDELIQTVFAKCPHKNVVNLDGDIVKSSVRRVGTDLLRAGEMYQPIQIAKVADAEYPIQCVSGRHRLTFLALAYGCDAEVRVEVEEMDLCTGRDAVIYANKCRSTTPMEKIVYTVLSDVKGDVSAKPGEKYRKTVTTKTKAAKFASYCVFQEEDPKLDFKVGNRKAGGLTTVAGAKGYWDQACQWSKGMPYDEFSTKLNNCVLFLNDLVEAMQELDGFDPSQHMASMALVAIGKMYYSFKYALGIEPDPVKAAEILVGMTDLGRQRSEATFEELSAGLRQAIS